MVVLVHHAAERLAGPEELVAALYTFKYVDGVDSIVAFMPPPPGEQAKATIFLRRQDVQDALERPLAETLPPPRTRFLPGKLSARELDAPRS